MLQTWEEKALKKLQKLVIGEMYGTTKITNQAGRDFEVILANPRKGVKRLSVWRLFKSNHIDCGFEVDYKVQEITAVMAVIRWVSTEASLPSDTGTQSLYLDDSGIGGGL